MKTTFKEQLANTIIAACSEATADCRHKLNSKDKKINPNLSAETVEKVKLFYSTANKHTMMQFYYELTQDSRFLDSYNANQLEPLVVLNMTQPGTLNTTKELMLVVSGKMFRILSKDGTEDSLVPFATKPEQLATPEEITLCIAQLSDAQWRYIMQSDLFAPLVKQTMEDEITISQH